MRASVVKSGARPGRVSGKVAVVTGGAGGFGAAFARTLVAEGAKVAITDVRQREGRSLAGSLGPSTCFFAHDVSSESEWARVIQATEDAFGPVSVLVNNAAILGSISSIRKFEEADYRRVIDVNQVSVFLGMKAVVPSMRKAGGGSIINVSSTSGLRGVPLSVAYTASKFAVRGMTKVAALEFARDGIRVNSIHPGPFRTAMGTSDPGRAAELRKVLPALPAGRYGEPEELAQMVLLLASDEMRYATGAEFVIDGGLTCR